jgi:tRNA G10  N-methylase Trm11
MKTFFILGRNPELSRHEVLEFLKARNREHKEIFFEENFLVIETNEDEKFDIQEFGGVMWLGEITTEGTNEDLAKDIEQKEIIPADKFSYAVFGNQDPQIIKDKFKQRKKKAMLKHGRQQIKFQDGTKHELPNADFYIFYHEFKRTVYFGIATQDYDDKGVKKRDMQKPARRESLAISPRLSKILINLSGAKPRDLLLDPFCGIGGILQEALIKKINVHGIDKDKAATEGAKQNLKWLTSEYNVKNNYKIENYDSRKAPDLQFAAIATETPLGKVLRKKPNDNEAKAIIQNFEAYIIPILKRLKTVKKPKAKIAITFPTIRTFHADAEKIANKCNLKIYIKPILESRPDQFISRDIVILQ